MVERMASFNIGFKSNVHKQHVDKILRIQCLRLHFQQLSSCQRRCLKWHDSWI